MKLNEIAILNERYVNAFDAQSKEAYAPEVWDILQKSYSKIGGLKSGGLDTIEGLIKNSKMWKLLKRDGKIKVVSIYKDKEGRKSVAVGTDGTQEAKLALAKMLKTEFENSYREVSDSMEAFIFKHVPHLANKYKIPVEIVKELVHDEIRPEEDGYHYKREIGGHWHTKIMLGTPGNKFF